MSFVAVAFLYPLLLAVLSTGAGLVVEALAGLRLPSTLLPAGGFALLLIVSQFTVISSATAPTTPWVLALLTIAGFVIGRGSVRARWSERRTGWWWAPAAAVACYVTVALPLI